MKLKNKLFSIAAAGMLVFSNVSTAVVSANDLTTMSQETRQAIYSSQPRTLDLPTKSTAIATDKVTVVNNVLKNANSKGADDVITIEGLRKDDIIKIYDTNGDKVLAKTTSRGGKTTIKVKQLGSTVGTIQVSVTNKLEGKYLTESSKSTITVPDEQKTTSISTANVAVANKTNADDIITVTGVTAGSIIQVKDSAKDKVLGKAKANNTGKAVIKLKQIGASSGTIKITATDKDKLESDVLNYTFSAEQKTTSISTANVAVVNNLNGNDTITVTHATAGTVINIYKDTTSKKPLASSKVNSNGIAKFSLKLDDTKDKLYVTATEKEKLESDRVEIEYELPPQSTSISTANIALVNKPAKSKDTVTVKNLTAGEIIKIYDENNKKLAETKAKSTTATLELTLPEVGKNIYVTRTQKDKRESTKATVVVTSVATTSPITATSATFVNNSDASDYVFVNGLTENDVIKIYDSASSGSLIGTATVAKGETQVYIKLKKKLDDNANVYVSKTSEGKEESSRVQATK